MHTDFLLSIVIITYNKLAYLRAVLRGLERQSEKHNQEIIIVNDGSTDDTKAFLDRKESKLDYRHIHLSNSGSSVARNTGIAMAQGEYILFLDNDIILEDSFVCHLRKSIIRYPNRIHSGKLRLIPLECVPAVFEMNEQQDVRYYFNYLERVSYLDAIYGSLQVAYQRKDDHPLACWWALATGGNMCFPKQVIQQVGVFDEVFKTWGPEDIDLCYRAFRENYLLKYNADCRLYHLDHPRNKNMIKEYMAKNVAQIYKKYKSKDILAYLNFFNGMISLNMFNNICCEIHNLENKIKLEEYYISLNYYINMDQIINWKSDRNYK